MRVAISALAVLLAVPIAAGAQEDPDRAVAGAAKLPAGWDARTDRGGPLDNVQFEERAGAYHVTLGPATVFYRTDNTASGNYQVTATFTQKRAPSHPEAYGLLIGGSDLDGEAQRYTYLIVRGSGQFMIKRRTGATTETVVPWTSSDAVQPAGDDGRCTNALAISVEGDQVKFMINGSEVHSAPAAELDTEGIYGLRINHNLDLEITGFGQS